MLKSLLSSSLTLHTASLACVVHCIVTPLLIGFSPAFSQYIHTPWIELSLLFTSVCCGTWIVYQGYCTHKKQHSIILFAMGSILWIVHTLLEHADIANAEYSLTLGSIFVLVSYYINHRYLKCCPSDCCRK